MARTSRLSYFQNIFDLLNVVRVEHHMEASAEIEAWETATRCTFPIALKEFYSSSVSLLRQSTTDREWSLSCPDLWSEYSNDEQASSIPRILDHVDRPERIRERVEPGPYFQLIVENQGNWIMYARACGVDDPPTYVTNVDTHFLGSTDARRLSDGWCCFGRFSDVIFDWFRYYYLLDCDFIPLSYHSYHALYPSAEAPARLYANGLWLRSPSEPFVPPVLDYLADHLGEAERMPLPDGVTAHTFRAPGGVIRVTADDPSTPEPLCAWWLHAETSEHLAALARFISSWGTLRDTLRADTDAARSVLHSLRH